VPDLACLNDWSEFPKSRLQAVLEMGKSSKLLITFMLRYLSLLNDPARERAIDFRSEFKLELVSIEQIRQLKSNQ
jgi:hypothetical protein